MSRFNIVNVIETKSRGLSLSSDDINNFIRCVFQKSVDDAQIGAFLMAVKINGMDARETADLTIAMAQYSEKFEWSKFDWKHKVVDKHSTGGVGDKISHILAPILAACGLKIPMISGRGLGITGGTIDKLEAINGFSPVLQMDHLGNILDRTGLFIIGQTEDMVPVDKCLYALRDVTATIDSIPLITASILCKKKIEDLQILLMDIKYGKGSFMKTPEDGEMLAKSMIDTGKSMDMKVICLLDEMNSPIGYCIGNAIEIAEVLRALNGSMSPDIEEIITVMVYQIMKSVHGDLTKEDIAKQMKTVIDNGKALEYLQMMLICQGVKEDLARKLCVHKLLTVQEYLAIMDQQSAEVTEILSERDGYISDIDAEKIGVIVRDLKGGRNRKNDLIDFKVGVELCVKETGAIKKNQPWAKIFHSLPLDDNVVKTVQSALTVVETKPAERKRITKILK